MKILLLCSQSPFPANEGASIAMSAVANGLNRLEHEVSILTFVSNKITINNNAVPLPFKDRFYAVPINLYINIFKSLQTFFSIKTPKIKRFFQKDFTKKLIELLEQTEFDIVQLETIYVASYIDIIRKHSKAKIVLRAHNVEHLIWERLEESTKNPFKQLFYNEIFKKTERFELEVINKVDAIVTITEYDFDRFRMMGFTGLMMSLPFGLDVEKVYSSNDEKAEIPTFCTIGSIGKKTNQEGIRWFLNNVWNLIHIQYPFVKFYFAGRNIPSWFKKKYKKREDIVIVGEVSDAYEFMRSKSVLIVPVLLGSGIRVKIIEGMACARPVITTTIGAEGIECENKKNISIADSPAQFFDAIELYIQHPEYVEKIGSEAQKLVSEKYNNKQLSNNLVDFYHTIIHQKFY